jgi:hypothetical protein
MSDDKKEAWHGTQRGLAPSAESKSNLATHPKTLPDARSIA